MLFDLLSVFIRVPVGCLKQDKGNNWLKLLYSTIRGITLQTTSFCLTLRLLNGINCVKFGFDGIGSFRSGRRVGQISVFPIYFDTSLAHYTASQRIQVIFLQVIPAKSFHMVYRKALSYMTSSIHLMHLTNCCNYFQLWLGM
jgi:hypothetical protein